MNKFRGLLVEDIHGSNVIMTGAPYDGNTSISKGASKAPQKFRDLSCYLPPFSMEGNPIDNVKICDMGDIAGNDYDLLFHKARNFIRSNKFKLIIGGDHSISIPFQKEFFSYCKDLGKEPVVVHIDAHCDISNIYNNSKYSHACTVRRALDHGLKQENLFMVGIREFEQDGYDFLIKDKNNVHLYTSLNILNNGLDKLLTDLKSYDDSKHLIYISFDIDALDASYVPGTGTPETCGLTPLIVRELLVNLAQFKNVEALDVVEISPPLDSNDITTWCALKLVYEFLYYKFKI